MVDVIEGENVMISPEVKRRKLMIKTRRLVIFAALSVIIAAILFTLPFASKQRLMLSWLTFVCGLIGGFVSIQQRLRRIDEEELALLTESWAAILVIPIYGAIFAEVLYVLFLSGLLKGDLFPAFYIPKFGDVPTAEMVVSFLTKTYPSTGPDLAKLMFWTFAAGFSERLVPQIVSRISSKVDNGNGSAAHVQEETVEQERPSDRS